jgi:hypothetical protein
MASTLRRSGTFSGSFPPTLVKNHGSPECEQYPPGTYFARIIERIGECCYERLNPVYIDHTVQQLLRQRIFGLVCGYEDLNDDDVGNRDGRYKRRTCQAA